MDKPSTSRRICAHQALAPIETLPTEIIQDIFKRCWNLSLPSASLHISSKLADPHLYDQYCDLKFEYPAPLHLHTPHGFRKDDEAFNRRWMTWSYFEQYLAKRIPPKACGCPIYITCQDEQHHGRSSAAVAGYDKSHDLSSFSSPLPIGPLRMSCRLPTKLTRGPWTKDKVEFVRCLLRISKMSVDWADLDSVHIAAHGKREAIMERSLDAVHMFSRARRLGKAPTLNLIKFAVIEGGCDRSIVFDLMTAAKEWGLRRWNDPELDAWVTQKEIEGDRKGSWLRLKLEEVRYGKMPNPTTGDLEGEVVEIIESPFRSW